MSDTRETSLAHECHQCMYRAVEKVETGHIDDAVTELQRALNGIATMPSRTGKEQLLKTAEFLHAMHDMGRKKFSTWQHHQRGA